MTATFSIPTAFGSPPHCWWALRINGDLDLSTGPVLDARLDHAIALHDGDGLVLDLSDVPFMDCAGLGPVLRARNSLGERFCLAAPRPRVMRLLDLAGVMHTLRILPRGDLWPAEAEARRCHVLLDHRPTHTTHATHATHPPRF